jgi:hypothetical protein
MLHRLFRYVSLLKKIKVTKTTAYMVFDWGTNGDERTFRNEKKI